MTRVASRPGHLISKVIKNFRQAVALIKDKSDGNLLTLYSKHLDFKNIYGFLSPV